MNFFSIGAAIRVELQSFPQVYTDTVDNPLCFLQYEESSLPPNQWQQVCTIMQSVVFYSIIIIHDYH